MSLKYAGSEILQMAVEVEKSGKAFYDNALQSIKDEKTRAVFQFLSDEEVKHIDIFKALLKQAGEVSKSTPYDDTEVLYYFRSIIDQRIFPAADEGKDMKSKIADAGVALRIAITLEKDSILFYHEMLPYTQEKDHPIIEKIIDEERYHIRHILQLKSEL